MAVIRWGLYAVAAIAALGGATALVGAMLPVAHRASRTVAFAQSPAAVFDVISDFPRHPEWRAGVKRVSVEGHGVGALVREHGTSGEMPYRIEVFERPARLVMRIADSSLAFGGTWTYTLAPSGTGTELTLTEDGEVYNVIFRALSRFVFGHHATIDGVLRDLRKRLTR